MRPRSRKWKKWERGKKRLRLRQASAVFDNLCEIASSVFFFHVVPSTAQRALQLADLVFLFPKRLDFSSSSSILF